MKLIVLLLPFALLTVAVKGAPIRHDVKSDNLTFTLVSWNILAEGYANPSWFPYTPPEELKWNFRGPLIISQLDKLNFDVAILQEVDALAFGNFSDAFQQDYYLDILYRPKTGYTDGCLTLVRKSMFKIDERWNISYPDEDKRVSLVLELENRENQMHVRVGNIHLSYNEELHLEQIELLQKVLREAGESKGPALVVFGGDHNFQPGSRGYEAIASNTSFQSCSVAVFGEEPAATFKSQPSKSETLDYVWYNNSMSSAWKLLVLEDVVEVDVSAAFPVQNLSSVPGLPSASVPSDHIPLGFIFSSTHFP